MSRRSSKLVLAPTAQPGGWAGDAELQARLGADALNWLRHLGDGEPLCIPALWPGTGPVRSRVRSPEVQVVVGEVIRDPQTKAWCGPVVIEQERVATYIDPQWLLHRNDCSRCASVWESVAEISTIESLFAVVAAPEGTFPPGSRLATALVR